MSPAPARPDEPIVDEPIVDELVDWFSRHGRALPWREEHPGAWGIFVVEVMSQQTPIQRVEPVWRQWLARWPTPDALASAPAGEVIRAWGRLGYPRRALQLQRAAKVIAREHDGQVPRSEAELLALPGVGPYTAAAVLAFAHGKRSVVLDTNIRRVLTRVLDGVALPPVHVRAEERVRAGRLVPRDEQQSVRWNAAVMEFGALVCTARRPACTACPVSTCAWREAGFPDNAPPRASQPWAGTDRQVRGALLAVLRGAPGEVPGQELAAQVRAAHPEVAPSQLERALQSLLADSLVQQAGSGFRLPE